MNFKDATNEIKSQFAKRRISAFAKRNNVSNDEVEVVDDEPIEALEREFKRSCGIRTRLYKNLTEEQQKAWLLYYNDHKKLSLKVKVKQNNEMIPHDDLNDEIVSNELPVVHDKSEKCEKQEKKVVKKRVVKKRDPTIQQATSSDDSNVSTKPIEQKPEQKPKRKHHKREPKNINSD